VNAILQAITWLREMVSVIVVVVVGSTTFGTQFLLRSPRVGCGIVKDAEGLVCAQDVMGKESTTSPASSLFKSKDQLINAVLE